MDSYSRLYSLNLDTRDIARALSNSTTLLRLTMERSAIPPALWEDRVNTPLLRHLIAHREQIMDEVRTAQEQGLPVVIQAWWYHHLEELSNAVYETGIADQNVELARTALVNASEARDRIHNRLHEVIQAAQDAQVGYAASVYGPIEEGDVLYEREEPIYVRSRSPTIIVSSRTPTVTTKPC